jgi:hypothetical protein
MKINAKQKLSRVGNGLGRALEIMAESYNESAAEEAKQIAIQEHVDALKELKPDHHIVFIEKD